jgi:beta-glucosidase/6-phospho-beta-glucosidase/beta-galactosidase
MIFQFLIVMIVLAQVFSQAEKFAAPIPTHIEKNIFPANFKFGVSTSSYQVEGGWLEGGKGMSIWDAYSHTPGFIANSDTGDIANDMYHLYPQDIELMAKMNVKNYRFSIAWNRILPSGTGTINQAGLDYYNDLINQLIAHNIEPHVTIYHSEMPLALTYYPNNPNPFLDTDRFPNWFTDYSKILFDNFSDRVKTWFTFNEPYCFAVYGTYGNIDPYIIAHNAILAHAQVVQLYRIHYQSKTQGTIGIVLNTAHFYPNDPTNPADLIAAQRGYGKFKFY